MSNIERPAISSSSYPRTSRQARFLIPMALSLGFGILFATFITLVLVPSLYMAVEDGKRGIALLTGRKPASDAPELPEADLASDADPAGGPRDRA